MDRITELENEIEAKMLRVQRLSSEPSPVHVEGEEYETWQKASKTKGALTLMLLDDVDALNDERLRLMVA